MTDLRLYKCFICLSRWKKI